MAKKTRDRQALKAVPQYIRNITKSVYYSGKDVMKEIMPATADFASSNSDLVKAMTQDVRNFKPIIKNSMKELENNDLIKVAKTYKNNFLSDLATGKFYNQDRDVEYAGKIEGFDDDDFGDFGDFSEDDNGSSSINKDKTIDVNIAKAQNQTAVNIGKAQIDVMRDTAKTISTSNIKSAEYVVDNQKAMFNQALVQNYNMQSQMNNALSDIAANVRGLFQYTNNISSYFQQSIKYMNDVTKMNNELNAYMRESIEMQRNRYKEYNKSLAQEFKNQATDDMNNFLNYSGGINFAEYGKFIKHNAKRELDNSMIGGMFNTLKGMGGGEGANPLLMFTSSPLAFLSKAMFNKAFVTKELKKSLGDFDKVFSTFASSFMLKMTSEFDAKAQNNPLFEVLSNIFGVHQKSQKQLRANEYVKGPVPFDGMTKKAITTVIPTYLSKILAAVTRNGEMVFNYDEGKFMTKAKLQEKMDADIHSTYGLSGTEFMFNKMFSKLGLSKKNMEALTKDLHKYVEFLSNTSHFANPNKDTYESLMSKGLSLDNGAGSYAIISAALKAMKKTDLMEINQNIGESLKGRARNMFNLQNNSSLKGYDNLLASKDDKFKYNNRSPIGIHSVDKYNKTIFDYLRDIRSVLVSGIRTFNTPLSAGFKKNKSEKFSTLLDSSDQLMEKFKNETVKFENDKDSKLEKQRGSGKYYLDDLSQAQDKEGALEAKFATIYEDTEKDKKQLTALDKTMNKYVSLFQAFKNGTDTIIKTPGRILASFADRMKEGMIDFLYGSDGEDKNKPLLDRLQDKISSKLNTLYDDINKTVILPIKESLLGKDGLITKLKAKFNPKFKKIEDTILGKLFGDKNAITGKREGGAFQIVRNKVKLTKNKFLNKLYGKEYYDENGNIVPYNSDNYFNKAKNKVAKGLNKAKNKIAGENGFIDRGGEAIGKAVQWVKNTFGLNKYDSPATAFREGVMPKLKGMGLGAGLGATLSLVTPFGLFGGMVLGSAAGLASKTDSFKDWLFGKDRQGGALPKSVYNAITKTSPDLKKYMGYGALAGLMTPLGLIGGTLVGGISAFLKNSDSFKDWLFGEKLSDGSRNDKNSIITTEMRKRLKKAMPVAGFGIAAGLLSKVGILGGLLLPGGPIGGAIVGMSAGLLGQSESVKKFLFGDKNPDDPKARRHGGLFGKLKTWFQFEIAEPIKLTFNKIRTKAAYFIKKNMINPLLDSMAPIKKEFQLMRDAIVNKVKSGFSAMVDGINNVFENTIGKPLGKLIKENVVDPLKKFFKGIFNGIGKVIGTVAASPFKLVNGVAMGLMKKHKKQGQDDYFAQWQIDKEERDKKTKSDYKNETSANKGNARLLKLAQNMMANANYDEKNPAYQKALGYMRMATTKEQADDNDNSVKKTVETPQESVNKFKDLVSKLFDKLITSVDKIGNTVTAQAVKREYGNTAGLQSPLGAKNGFVMSGNLKDKSNEVLSDKAKTIKRPKQLLLTDGTHPKTEVAKDGTPIHGSHAKGLDSVPFNGYIAELHKGESVIPGGGTILQGIYAYGKSTFENVRGLYNIFSAKFLKGGKKPTDPLSSDDFNSESSKKNADNDITDEYSVKGNLKIIRNEVQGQLDGVGYETEYIRRILEKAFGSPDQMPGEYHTRGNRKRRTVIGRAFQWIKNAITNPFEFIKSKIFGFVGNIKKKIFKIKSKVKNLFKSIIELPKKIIGGIINIGKKVIPAIWNIGKEVVTTFWTAGKEVVKTVWSGFKEVISTGWTAIKTVVGGIYNAIKPALKLAGKAIAGVTKIAWSIGKEFVKTAWGVGKEVVKTTWNIGKEVASTVWNVGKEVIKTGWNVVKGAVSAGFGGIKAIAGGIWNKLTGTKTKMVNKVEIVGGKLDYVNRVGQVISIPGPDGVPLVSDTAETGFQLVGGVANSAASGVKATIKKGVNNIENMIKSSKEKKAADANNKKLLGAADSNTGTFQIIKEKFGGKSIWSKIMTFILPFVPKIIELGKKIKNFILHPFDSLMGLLSNSFPNLFQKGETKVTQTIKGKTEEATKNKTEEAIKKQAEEKAKKEAEEKAKKEAEEKAKKEAEEKSKNLIKGKTEGKIKDDAEEKVKSTIKNKFKNEAKDTAESEAKSTIKNKAKDAAESEVKSTIKNKAKDAAEKEVKSTIKNKAENATEKEVKNKVKSTIKSSLTNEAGQFLLPAPKAEVKKLSKDAVKNIAKKDLIEGAEFTVKDEAKSGVENKVKSTIKSSLTNKAGQFLLPAPKAEAENKIKSTIKSSLTNEAGQFLLPAPKSEVKNKVKSTIDNTIKDKVESAAKSETKKIGKDAVKNIAKKDLIKGVKFTVKDEAKNAIGKKGIGAILDKIFKSSFMKKILEKFGATAIADKIRKFLTTKLSKVGATAIAKLAAKWGGNAILGTVTAGLVPLGFAGLSFALGAYETKKIFGLPNDSSPTAGMRLVAGLAKAIDDNITQGLIPVSTIAAFLAPMLLSKETKSALDSLQGQAKTKYEDYKKKTGSKKSFEEYNEEQNATIIDKAENKLKSGAKSLWNGAKTLGGGIAKGASKVWNGVKWAGSGIIAKGAKALWSDTKDHFANRSVLGGLSASNTARVMGIKDPKKVSLGDRLSVGLGNAISELTFGKIDNKNAALTIKGFGTEAKHGILNNTSLGALSTDTVANLTGKKASDVGFGDRASVAIGNTAHLLTFGAIDNKKAIAGVQAFQKTMGEVGDSVGKWASNKKKEIKTKLDNIDNKLGSVLGMKDDKTGKTIGFGAGMKQSFKDTINNLQSFAGEAKKNASEWWNKTAKPGIKGAFDALDNGLGQATIGMPLSDGIKKGAEKLGEAIQNKWKDVAATAASVWNGAKQKAKDLWSWVSTPFKQAKTIGQATVDVKNQGGYGTGSGSATSATEPVIHGMTYYSQYDNRWANTPYNPPGGTGKTILTSACGPTSAAMVLSSLTGKTISPVDAANYSLQHGYRVSEGTSWEFFNSIGNKYGIGFTSTSSPDAVKAALKNKQPVILSGTGSKPFTSKGHFVVAAGINGDGSININDPISQARSTSYSANSLFSSFRNGWIANKSLTGNAAVAAATGSLTGTDSSSSSNNSSSSDSDSDDPLTSFLSNMTDLTTGFFTTGLTQPFNSNYLESQITSSEQNDAASANPTAGNSSINTGVSKYSAVFKEYGKKYGIDPGLVAAVAMQESGGDPRCGYSSAPAWGLTQIEYTNNSDFGKFGQSTTGTYWTPEDKLDPTKAIAYTSHLLGSYYKQYNGDIKKTLAAYNFGQGGLQTLINQYGSDWMDHRKDYRGGGDKQYYEHVMRYYKQGGEGGDNIHVSARDNSLVKAINATTSKPKQAYTAANINRFISSSTRGIIDDVNNALVAKKITENGSSSGSSQFAGMKEIIELLKSINSNTAAIATDTTTIATAKKSNNNINNNSDSISSAESANKTNYSTMGVDTPTSNAINNAYVNAKAIAAGIE